jgi:hypothetical protein
MSTDDRPYSHHYYHLAIDITKVLSNVIPNGIIIGNKRRKRIHMQVARKQ